VKGGPVSCIFAIGDVLVVVRESNLGGFREGGIALLDGNFTGKVGGGGGGGVVGHTRKLARDSDNATKKMFFFDVFFLDFSQLIEREELTPIGPRRGRGDVSFLFPMTYNGSGNVVMLCTMCHTTTSVVVKHTALATMSCSSSLMRRIPPLPRFPLRLLVRSQVAHSWGSCCPLLLSSLPMYPCDHIEERCRVDHRVTSL